MTKHRIRKYDSRNWVLESYRPPKTIPKGLVNEGQMSKPKWINEGFYPRLEHIPPRYLEQYLSGSYSDVQSILAAIEQAKQEILEEIRGWVRKL